MAAAAPSSYCRFNLQRNLLLWNKNNNSNEGHSSILRDSMRKSWISPRNNILHNHFVLSSGIEKGYKKKPNQGQTKVSVRRDGLVQLFGFNGPDPLGNDHMGLRQSHVFKGNHVCKGNGLAASTNANAHANVDADADADASHRECRNDGDFEEEQNMNSSILKGWAPPRNVWRALAAWVIAGQVIARVGRGRIHWRNCLQQLEVVGPGSIGVCLLTAAFVGMAFTIQFVREFTRLGLTRSVGGVLALALSRELSPVVTAIIIAGRVGSAFAAELGTMQVSEQTDTLRVLGTDPVDYLVIPRVFACSVALPVLTLICFTVAMAASVLLADGVYSVSANIILDSARRALHPWDIISAMIKSTVFGGLISVVSCAWGVTTLGGAKGVGESTTSAVVISLVCIFIADFVLSWCFFQGAGDALKAAMG